MFERSHLSIGGVLGHGTVTTTPRYLDKHYPPITVYELFFSTNVQIGLIKCVALIVYSD